MASGLASLSAAADLLLLIEGSTDSNNISQLKLASGNVVKLQNDNDVNLNNRTSHVEVFGQHFLNQKHLGNINVFQDQQGQDVSQLLQSYRTQQFSLGQHQNLASTHLDTNQLTQQLLVQHCLGQQRIGLQQFHPKHLEQNCMDPNQINQQQQLLQYHLLQKQLSQQHFGHLQFGSSSLNDQHMAQLLPLQQNYDQQHLGHQPQHLLNDQQNKQSVQQSGKSHVDQQNFEQQSDAPPLKRKRNAITLAQKDQIVKLRRQGASRRAIAEAFSISADTVKNIIYRSGKGGLEMEADRKRCRHSRKSERAAEEQRLRSLQPGSADTAKVT